MSALELAARDAAEACATEAAEAARWPAETGCRGCGCVRVLITGRGLVCALCGAPA